MRPESWWGRRAWPTTHKSHNGFWRGFSTHRLRRFGPDGTCGGGRFSNRSEPSEAHPANPIWAGAGSDLFWWLYSMHRNRCKVEASHLSFWRKEWVLRVRITRVEWSWCLGAHQGIPRVFLIPRSRAGRSEVEEVLYHPRGWFWDHTVSGEPVYRLWLYWRHQQSRDSLQGHPANPPGHMSQEWIVE